MPSWPSPQPKTSSSRTIFFEPGLVIGSTVLPGWAVWTIFNRWNCERDDGIQRSQKLLPIVFHGVVAACLASIPMIILTQYHLHESTPAELTAQNVMRMSATGWWLGSTWVSLAGAVTWIAWRNKFMRGPGSMLAALFAIGGLIISPLFALPFALAAMLHRHRIMPHPASGILAATGNPQRTDFSWAVAPQLWGVFGSSPCPH